MNLHTDLSALPVEEALAIEDRVLRATADDGETGTVVLVPRSMAEKVAGLRYDPEAVRFMTSDLIPDGEAFVLDLGLMRREVHPEPPYSRDLLRDF